MTQQRQIKLSFLIVLVAISVTFAIIINNDTNITCNPVYKIMEQWLPNPNELKCYKT